MRLGIDARSLEGNTTGVGRYVSNILRHWRGIIPQETEIFLYFQKERPFLPELAASVFRPRLLKPLLGKQSAFAFTHFLLPQAVKYDSIDVLWCPAYIAPLRCAVPFVLTLHDIIFSAKPELYDWPSAFDRFALAWTAERSAQRARVILVPSEFTKREVMRYWRISENRILVTPLAASPAVHEEHGPRCSTMLASYGIQNKFIFFVGSLFRRRYPFEMLEAFASVARTVPNMQFLIGGALAMPNPNRWLEMLARLNRTLGYHAVVHRPYIPQADLPIFYRHAEAFLWFSEYEGFGLPPLEAMAQGTPVITTGKGSLREVMGECGEFVAEPAGPDAIAEAVLRVVRDPERRAQLSRCSLPRARLFSWEECSRKTFDAIYQAGQTVAL